MLPVRRTLTLTPAQALYALDRLLTDRRISAAEVDRYAADIRREIAVVESRLAQLRGVSAASTHHATPSAPAAEAPKSRQGRTRRRRIGNPLAGRYMGYMRQVRDERKKAEFRRVKEERGYDEAIAALRQHLRK